MGNILFATILFYFIGVGDDQKRVVIFGDSITQDGRYITVLRSSTDYSFDRYSSAGKPSTHFRMVFEKYGFDGVYATIVQCGVNNIDNPTQIIKDFEVMQNIAEKDEFKLYVLAIMPFKGYPTWTDEKQKNLEMVNLWLKNQNYLTFIDTYSILVDEKQYNKYSDDKLHPNEEGQNLIGEKIVEYLKN